MGRTHGFLSKLLYKAFSQDLRYTSVTFQPRNTKWNPEVQVSIVMVKHLLTMTGLLSRMTPTNKEQDLCQQGKLLDTWLWVS